MKIVISQPMLFPWIGLFEQIRLADLYVHYSDVQFSKGSFVNRVQIKTAQGSKWMTVPLAEVSLGQKINEVRIDYRKDWRTQHLQLLARSYAGAPYLKQMLAMVEVVYDHDYATIDQLSEASVTAVCDYFSLNRGRRFMHSTEFQIQGASSRRVLEIVLAAGSNEYITGHGAQYYLDHELFEASKVEINYMNYKKTPYAQLHGEFTPYVSALDLIANLGSDGGKLLQSGTTQWRNFVNHE